MKIERKEQIKASVEVWNEYEEKLLYNKVISLSKMNKSRINSPFVSN